MEDASQVSRAEAEAEAVEELVALVLEHLVPVVGWYRDQLARRLGTTPEALTVLEQARRRPTSASRAARWTGMTASAMTKVIRRLEEAGHVERRPSADHDQELLVALLPHAERDRLTDGVRNRLRGSMEHLVVSFGLTDPHRRRAAANALVHAAAALGREASALSDRAEHRRMTARRHRSRVAAGLHP